MKRFAGLPEEYSGYGRSAAAILPVPYEGTVSYGKGASKGPGAIIAASQELELYDIETDSEPFEAGIFTDIPIECPKDSKEVSALVERRVSRLLADGKFPIVIGGEHSISIGSARAHAKFHDRLSVLQLDAHADLRAEFEGDRYSHACTMRRISEIGVPIVQAGIRSMDIEEKYVLQRIRSRVIYSHRMYESWIDTILENLKQDVFVTIDVDVFDPSIMPATGTPEPGGLTWDQVTSLMSRLFRAKNVTGVDITELAPISASHAPDYLAAKLIYKIISYHAKRTS